MFNLDQAIEQWRRQLAVGGIKSLEALDELESHLREEVRHQLEAGLDEAQAFAVAVGRIGEACELKREFSKVEPASRELLRKLKRFLLGGPEIPFPTLEIFTPNSRQVLEFAPEEARRFRHDFVGTEHLLLGLTKATSGVLANVMRRLGVDTDSIRLEVGKLVHYGVANAEATEIPFTPRARRALQLAVKEASALRQDLVRPEHVFLGLLLEGSGVAALALKELGIRSEDAREELLKEMRANPDAS